MPLFHPMPPQDSETARWFAEHVQPHEGMLRGYLSGIAAWADIDDLVQETYVRLLRTRELREVRSPRAFLFTTARNAAHDLFRRRATAKLSSITEIDCSRVSDEAPAPPEVVSLQQEVELLRQAIEALPARCRDVLQLRRFENLSHREIAQRLGISENTVEVHLANALRRCEKFLARNGMASRL